MQRPASEARDPTEKVKGELQRSDPQLDLFHIVRQPLALPPRTDITVSHHRGADTSAEAHASVSDSTRAAQRNRILEFIRTSDGGATCDQVEVCLQLSHQTASARITELSALHLISHSDERRKTRSGRSARVYRIGGGNT